MDLIKKINSSGSSILRNKEFYYYKEHKSIYHQDESINNSKYYSPVSLKLLNIEEKHVGIQFGCFNYTSLIYLSNSCKILIIYDENKENLINIKKFIRKANIDNILLINNYLEEDGILENYFDFVILNLTWEINRDKNKILTIISFVSKILNKSGKFFFEFDNKYYFRNFFSYKVVMGFITRKRWASMLEKNYFNFYTYVVFPDKQFPLRIYPVLSSKNILYEDIGIMIPNNFIYYKVKRKFQMTLNKLIFKTLKLFNLAPAFIFISRLDKRYKK